MDYQRIEFGYDEGHRSGEHVYGFTVTDHEAAIGGVMCPRKFRFDLPRPIAPTDIPDVVIQLEDDGPLWVTVPGIGRVDSSDIQTV
jgi:hypothetical protein